MVYELMLKRRSIRRFKATQPKPELLEKIVAAAITAPSASNKQPWKFLLVTNQLLIDKAADKVKTEIDRLTTMLAPTFQEGFANYAENFTIFKRAPALIVPLYRVFPLLSHLFPPDSAKHNFPVEQVEQKSALISVSCAIQNMLLMAEESGLGACCMTGPLLARETLQKLFKVPDGWEIASLIAIGFPDERPEMPERKNLDSTLKWIS